MPMQPSSQNHGPSYTRFPALNASSSVIIPSFALVRVTGANVDGTLTVDQPGTDGEDVFVNGPVPIQPSSHGIVSRDWPVHALYDSGDGTPANGETWGAGAGSYKLRKGKTGFTVLGGAVADASIALVVGTGVAGPLGTPMNVVTRVCPTFGPIISGSGSGALRYLTGLSMEYTSILAVPDPGSGGGKHCIPNPSGCCPPPPVAVPCCPGVDVPQSLTFTFFDGTGACDCLNGFSATLAYDLARGNWNYFSSDLGLTCLCDSLGIESNFSVAMHAQLRCVAPNWFLAVVLDGAGFLNANSADGCSGGQAVAAGSCDPFDMTFDSSGLGGSFVNQCGGPPFIGCCTSDGLTPSTIKAHVTE